MMTTSLVGLGTFVVGFIIGLVVFGWWLTPVEWENASPEHLGPVSKADYVQMVADSFALTGDAARAQARLVKLGSDAKQVLNSTQLSASGADNIRVSQLASAVGNNLPADGGQGTDGGGGGLASLILPVCAALLLLLILLGGGAFLYMRFVGGMPRSKSPARPASGVTQGSVATRVETPPEIVAEAGAEPVTTFKTTYMLGNDLFDESFSIDDQQGDFLGECGVGIGETIGVGDPKKVTAFEVWLFDKNDIRTVTKVVMSEHAFNDESLKSRLSAKGEPVMARPEAVVEMETATLKVAARIVDMQYGSGALPPSSFFQQLTLEISAWKKSES